MDLIDTSSNPPQTNGVVNRMNLPADASIQVTLAQCLGILLIVNFAVAEGDLLRGISNLLDGWDPALIRENPHAKRTYSSTLCTLMYKKKYTFCRQRQRI